MNQPANESHVESDAKSETESSPKQSIDRRLALGYGSAWHLLRCLGWHREYFSKQVAETIGAENVEWLDFPPLSHRNKKERIYTTKVPVRDSEWERINFIDDAQVQAEYNKFWPIRGSQQNWDAIGKATFSQQSQQEWLLVEAKAHINEVKSGGTGAKGDSLNRIQAAFCETLKKLGHPTEKATRLAPNWLKCYYQHANRIATLHFLIEHGIPAQLVFVYFCGDWPGDNRRCPATPDKWADTIQRVKNCLGLRGNSELEQRIHNVFIDVNCRAEKGQT